MMTWAFAGGAKALRGSLIRCAFGMSAVCTLAWPAGATSPDGATSALRELIAAGQLAELRWPNFADYRADVQSFYEASGYEDAWSHDGRPTPQAQAIIAALQRAEQKGLDPEDYDASRWPARLQQLSQPGAAAQFDLALTVDLMRYVSALHIGRVNPQQFKFAIAERESRYDLAQFLRQDLVASRDVTAALNAVEPRFRGYKRTLAALQRYLELAHQDDGEPLPAPAKGLNVGGHYAGVTRLAQRLRLLGDLPADAPAPGSDLYQPELADAVRRFQERHGLETDGRLGAQTIKELNTPLSTRVEQLRLTLERWRWLPPEFPQPPVVVNIPEFRLRALDADNNFVLTMNVIVGKALRHETPVFDKDMQYVVFRPYWNVPPQHPAQRDRARHPARPQLRCTEELRGDHPRRASRDLRHHQRRGPGAAAHRKLAVRQKPGPGNALGLIKLIFPNEYNVYLHSTPSQQLFSQSRRDFSHGCIRVEKPEELAAWALRDKPEWTLERIRKAMQEGPDNVQVNLTKPIPVLILYGTAVTDESGAVHFYDDIYGHDAALRKALAKGYPYRR